MKILGLIPARGGSKGVLRKNIKPLCGKPLIEYTAEAALATRRLTRVILSTDDAEIAEAGKHCGLEVPFMRPAALAQDATPMIEVVKHAVEFMGALEAFDAVCLLQPTNPLRKAEDIDGCIELFQKSGADSVASMLALPESFNPHWVYFQDKDGTLHLSTGAKEPVSRRQDLPRAFHREGSVYVTKWSIAKQGSLYGTRLLGYPMDPERSVNIDNEEDWQRAEQLMKKRGR